MMKEKPVISNLSLNWHIQIYYGWSLRNLKANDQQSETINPKQSDEIKMRQVSIM